MWTQAQRVETEAIACGLDGLKKRAEGSELRLIAFLIDIALSEARDELAHGEWPTERSGVAFHAIRPSVGPERPRSAKMCRQTASNGRGAHDPYAERIVLFRSPVAVR
jgi:hypothetical protein